MSTANTADVSTVTRRPSANTVTSRRSAKTADVSTDVSANMADLSTVTGRRSANTAHVSTANAADVSVEDTVVTVTSPKKTFAAETSSPERKSCLRLNVKRKTAVKRKSAEKRKSVVFVEPADIMVYERETTEPSASAAKRAVKKTRLSRKKSTEKPKRKPSLLPADKQESEYVSPYFKFGSLMTGKKLLLPPPVKPASLPKTTAVEQDTGLAVKRQRMSTPSDDDHNDNDYNDDDDFDDLSDGEPGEATKVIVTEFPGRPDDEVASTSSSWPSFGMNGMPWRDHAANAQWLLTEYDGTQSVDVEELFDKRNVAETLNSSKVITIDDDDEWAQMPEQLASIRSTLHTHSIHTHSCPLSTHRHL